MITNSVLRFDPKLDLKLERVVDVPREQLWEAWTTPKDMPKWFCPAPWSVPKCEIDLRPGGMFRTIMRSPEGDEHENVGCYLEIVPNERLVWTSAMQPGFRPVADSFLPFTAVILFEPEGSGTRYTALAIHQDEAGMKKHAEMGFEQGWGIVLDQLVAFIKSR